MDESDELRFTGSDRKIATGGGVRDLNPTHSAWPEHGWSDPMSSEAEIPDIFLSFQIAEVSPLVELLVPSGFVPQDVAELDGICAIAAAMSRAEWATIWSRESDAELGSRSGLLVWTDDITAVGGSELLTKWRTGFVDEAPAVCVVIHRASATSRNEFDLSVTRKVRRKSRSARFRVATIGSYRYRVTRPA